MNRADRRKFSLKERRGMSAASVCIANYVRELNENTELTEEKLEKINKDFCIIWDAICHKYPNINKNHFKEEWLLDKPEKDRVLTMNQKFADIYLQKKQKPYIKPKGAENE